MEKRQNYYLNSILFIRIPNKRASTLSYFDKAVAGFLICMVKIFFPINKFLSLKDRKIFFVSFFKFNSDIILSFKKNNKLISLFI